jgi:hypothetical protein
LIFMFQKVQQGQVIGFPEEMLSRQGETQVIEVLKDRRKKICEFTMKVINDFNLHEVISKYFTLFRPYRR